MRPKIYRHIGHHLVGPSLCRAICRAMEVGYSAIEGYAGDKTLARSCHDRRGVPGGNIVGAQTHVDHVDKVQRLFPEGAGRDQVHRVNGGGIVDQDIDLASLRLDPGKGACHRFIVGMVTGYGDRRSAELLDLGSDV